MHVAILYNLAQFHSFWNSRSSLRSIFKLNIDFQLGRDSAPEDCSVESLQVPLSMVKVVSLCQEVRLKGIQLRLSSYSGVSSSWGTLGSHVAGDQYIE